MEVNCNKSSGLIEYVLRGVGLVHDEGRPLGVLLGVLTGVFDQQVAVVQELHLQHLEQHHLVYIFISFATQRSVLSRFHVYGGLLVGAVHAGPGQHVRLLGHEGGRAHDHVAPVVRE